MTAIVQCVFGMRGAGKSTLARWLVEDREKILAFDPQGDYCGRGWRACSSRAEVKAAVLASAGGPFRISYIPDFHGVSPVAEAVFLAEVARIIQGGYPERDKRPLTVIFDEAHEAFPNRRFAAGEGPLRYLVLQGRHAGIGLIVVTQRPSNVNTDVRGQAAETYAFDLPGVHDRKAVAALHVDAGAMLARVKNRDFIKIDRQGVKLQRLALRSGVKTLAA